MGQRVAAAHTESRGHVRNADDGETRRKFMLYCFVIYQMHSKNTVCPTRYRTRHFFNNFTTNEDIATKFEADLPHCVRNVTTS